mmetsp:Transcript_112332/g.324480  ORF Transcript_112332/g.324480 Transcript_112332/m.324480 type:complete len:207 (-) Transcript_112332:286-906(-)|eukprot:CAMPEP_0176021938 /NCGR_PEP_ID=MMETSP0120_2-20121206/10667_1 /TAXON_ID=160619 /ORGANISM="Kryptoperidinium foliaceum, Strain CCMP 1326" /LENGTH=206 /DNA_ID=CAMNT_0017355067 /DNA_START=132 /DNA_END=752 /DNA_ORIENTATION=-
MGVTSTHCVAPCSSEKCPSGADALCGGDDLLERDGCLRGAHVDEVYPADSFVFMEQQLLRAAADGDIREAERALAYGACIEARRPIRLRCPRQTAGEVTDAGLTPLMYAAKSGCVAMCRLLLARGARLDVMDEDGWRPLHFAAAFGNADACGALVDAGADATAVDEQGLSAMDYVPGELTSSAEGWHHWNLLLRPHAGKVSESRAL